ncbi:hypothetical protein IGI37_000168 [Enterococcus sp. AZ194]|uniref:sulfite exporter TauE/SafE family protein n=1 Tax=Enterococcus sp. AZ194 TaxID=2774629 RepID=UPI003F208A75
MIGILYFVVIIIANTIGAISGMGGGVIIKPIFDLIDYHSVAAISFYSTVAVFTMSISSTLRQLARGQSINFSIVLWISLGALVGGVLGNSVFEQLLLLFDNEKDVQLIQIIITVGSLLFAFLYTRYPWRSFQLMTYSGYLSCGVILGFLASLLGIGGGPINVSLLMLMFSLPIKEATVYSIATIFFSQLAKLLTILFGSGLARYDLSVLLYIIPAAILGGLIGAALSQLLSAKKVTSIFLIVILVVLFINIYNGVHLLSLV